MSLKELKVPSSMKKNLDKQQLEAVQAPLTNVVVRAVAGSGKTRVLTHRVANLIFNGVPENEIVLLTFTNKAAKEMSDRIDELLGAKNNIVTGTFHSVAIRFLRQYQTPNNFSILDEEAASSLIRSARKEYSEANNMKAKDIIEPDKIRRILSMMKNHKMPIRRAMKIMQVDDISQVSYVKEIEKMYEEKKAFQNLMDFDDILLNYIEFLKSESGDFVTQRYQYVFVDEYQDINWMQNEILHLMNRTHTMTPNNNMFVVGDKSQCIYQFRGSLDHYIDQFSDDYKDVLEFTINMNYRSAPDILDKAERLINHNTLVEPIRLRPFKEEEDTMVYINAYMNDFDQADSIFDIIEDRIGYDNYDQVAILVRSRYQYKDLERVARMRDIPHVIVGGDSFFDKAHIKDILSLMSFLTNKRNQPHFMRICTLVPGVGDVTATRLYTDFETNGFDLEKSLGFQKGKYDDFIQMLADLEGYLDEPDVLIDLYLKDFYSNYLVDQTSDAHERLSDAVSLSQMAARYDSSTEFVHKFMLDREIQKVDKDEKQVTITTMHRAKGLEWDYVFLPNMLEGEFPKIKNPENSFNSTKEQEENERNLFYVALTRARKECYISYQQISGLGWNGMTQGLPSPFLLELDYDPLDPEKFEFDWE